MYAYISVILLSSVLQVSIYACKSDARGFGGEGRDMGKTAPHIRIQRMGSKLKHE